MRSDPGAGPLLLSEADALLGPYLRNPEAPVVLAVSGGPDSVSLMQLSARLRGIGRLAPVMVATVDHGLRPEARREAEQVAAWAADLALPHRILAWAGRPRSAIQAQARDARYELLESFARENGAGEVLTAHTLDDQAETVLLRVFAGSGLTGLSGMTATTDRGGVRLSRPFLAVPKARLLATCASEGWPFISDPSNDDPRFGRVRIRKLMPSLAAEGLSPRRLVRLAARARRADEALASTSASAYARLLLEEGPALLVLDGAGLRAEPAEIVIRVLALCIGRVAAAKRRLSLARLERLAEELRHTIVGGGDEMKATLGGALLALGGDGRLTVTPEPLRRRAAAGEGGR